MFSPAFTLRIFLMAHLALCLSGHSAFCQQKQSAIPIPDRRISLDITDHTLLHVLREMEERAGFVFSYRSDLIETDKMVSIHVVNKSVREILHTLFGRQLAYRQRGKFLILSPSRGDSGSRKTIDGYIVDNEGKGISSVTVYDPVTLASATSNRYGYYELRIQPMEMPPHLEVRKSQFRDTLVPLESSSTMLADMAIEPDTSFRRRMRMWADTTGVLFNRMSHTLFPGREELVNVQDTIYRDVQVSLVPFVGTNRKMSGQVINRTSFNVIGGYARGVQGVEIGGLANLIRDDVQGAQVSGLLNLTGGKVDGVQLAGYSNITLGQASGVWVSGFSNYLHQEAGGVGIAGFAQVFRKTFDGVAVSGFSNVAVRRASGVFLSGFSNVVADSAEGVFVTGFANVLSRSSSGVQVAGFSNVVAGDWEGVQVSGFFNYARRIGGAQVGVFNVCDSLSGIPVGFLSYVHKGYHPMELAWTDLGTAEFSWRTGVRAFYTFVSAGASPGNLEGKVAWNFGYGLGTSPALGKRAWLNVEVSSHHLSRGAFAEQLSLDNRLALLPEVRISRWMTLFGGPVAHAFLDHTNTPDLRDELGLPSRYVTEDNWDTLRLSSWLGWKAGIRIGRG